MSEQDAKEFWESRYLERDQIWSGKANVALQDTVSDLPVGDALDLGCGEGGDALWLATRGWRVTGVDISAAAIERAKRAASERGIPTEALNWVVSDLSAWTPTQSYDLVLSCFMHSPVDFPRTEVLQRAASTVKVGGHLFVVGHASAPSWMDSHAHGTHHFLGPEEEIANLALPASSWESVVSEVRIRKTQGPAGASEAMVEDSVVLLRRM